MSSKPVVEIKESEIRPDHLLNEFMSLSIDDAQNFFDHQKFIQVACPACGEVTTTEQSFDKLSFHYAHCSSCKSLYASPRPSEEELLRYYAESASQRFWFEVILKHTGEKRKESITLPALERVDTIMKEVVKKEPATVLDVGAANGTFLLEWKKHHPEAHLIAIEPGAESAQKCREYNIEVFEGFVEDEAEKKAATGDLVTCFEVLEHVQNPERFTKALYKATAPGGVAIVSCLGVDGFDIQVMWEQARCVMPPYHLNFLSKQGMKHIFDKSGFDHVEILTPGRMDVDIVVRAMEQGLGPKLSRFESLLLSQSKETRQAFQKFLSENAMSSHVWIIAYKN